MNTDLLNKLLNDEKKVDRELYSSGSYWDYKNRKAVYQLKKNGLENFRGLNSGVGTSYTDNLVYDFRNELNLKGRLVSAFFDLPLIKKIFQGQLAVTSDHINNYCKQALPTLPGTRMHSVPIMSIVVSILIIAAACNLMALH